MLKCVNFLSTITQCHFHSRFETNRLLGGLRIRLTKPILHAFIIIQNCCKHSTVPVLSHLCASLNSWQQIKLCFKTVSLFLWSTLQPFYSWGDQYWGSCTFHCVYILCITHCFANNWHLLIFLISSDTFIWSARVGSVCFSFCQCICVKHI